MDDLTEPTARQPAWRRRARGVGLAVGGLLVGGVLAGTLTATASTTTTPTTPSESSTSIEEGDAVDESQPQRSDEDLLTGDLLQQVTDAVLAEYPGATIVRAETDSDGVYETHLSTADRERVTVELDEDLAITGTEAAGGPDGPCGPGGPGDRGSPSSDGEATTEPESTG